MHLKHYLALVTFGQLSSPWSCAGGG